MVRKSHEPEPVTKADLLSALGTFRDDVKAGFTDLRTELKADIARFDEKLDRVAIELIRTRAEVATKAELAVIESKLDRRMSAMDAYAGEVADVKRIFTVWSQILTDHRQRLESMESWRAGFRTP